MSSQGLARLGTRRSALAGVPWQATGSPATAATAATITRPCPPTRTRPLLQTGRTALLTIAELLQNVSSQHTQFNWELVFEAQSGKAFPVKLEIVSYNASRTPSNGQTILTLSSNSTGIEIFGDNSIGREQRGARPSLSAALLRAGLELPHPLPVVTCALQISTFLPSTPAAPLLGSSPPASATPTMHATLGPARS